MSKLILEDLTYEVIGACMEVHRHLGCGFLEAVYQEALELEFQRRGITSEREKEICIEYKGRALAKKYYADFVCYGVVIVELKALSEICGEHESQLINYLKATGLGVGLLVNFGQTSLQQKRFVYNKSVKSVKSAD